MQGVHNPRSLRRHRNNCQGTKEKIGTQKKIKTYQPLGEIEFICWVGREEEWSYQHEKKRTKQGSVEALLTFFHT